MAIDTTLIAATATTAANWLWDKFGQQWIDAGKQEARWRLGVEKYYSSLYKNVGFVRVLGKQEAEPLENIFTDVNILDKPTAEERYRLGEMGEVWQGRRFHYGRVERHEGMYALENYDKLFILGKPGAGKTTFLKWTALQAIERKIEKFPIFVTLKAMSDDNPQLRNWEEVVAYIVKRTVHRIPDAHDFVTRMLHNGGAIVLFDGLDEVNVEGERRSNLINALNQFVGEFNESQILITCRVAATDYSFTQFEYVEMADFSDLQISAFVNRWFSYDEQKRDECRQQLTGEDANAMLQELARVPLLLTLLCLVYEERNEFPPNRAEIYEEATRALLSKWDGSRNIRRDSDYEALTIRRKGQLLATISAQTFQNGEFFIERKKLVRLIEQYLQNIPTIEEPDGEKVLQEIAAQHGLLVERAKGIYSFSHLTLQEYFCARYIVDNEARGTLSKLMKRISDERWQEVFLLIAGMLDDAANFAVAYRQALWELIQKDETCAAVIAWLRQKQALCEAQYTASAIRSFYIYFALVHTRASIRYRARALARALGLDFASNSDLDLDLALDLSLDLSLELKRGVEANSLDFALYASTKLGLAQLHKKLIWLKDNQPQHGDDSSWHKWTKQLREVVISERNIGHQWGWTEKNAALLYRYLKGNLLLVECLKLAVMPRAVREEIENSLLMPLP